MALWRGDLPAAKLRRPTAAGSREFYAIKPSDLRHYVDSRSPERVSWTEDMDCGLLELISTCTVIQAAKYLGVSTQSAAHRIQRLRRSGVTIGSLKRPMSPFVTPGDAILLARTCIKCGVFRDAGQYRDQRGQAGQVSTCRTCESRDSSRRNRQYVKARAKTLQDISLPKAENKQQEWTASNDEALSDKTRSNFELAIELKRTYYSVGARRSKIGVIKHDRKIDPNAIWSISLPAAKEAIRDHFRAIGQPVPEDFWDWNDGGIR
jgi:hypothetical protein